MTSIIAFLIALTFGTADVRTADYQNFQEAEQVQMTSKNDGSGINGEGGQMTDPTRP